MVSSLGVLLEFLYYAHMIDNYWPMLSIVATLLVAFPALYTILFIKGRSLNLFLIFVLALFVQSMYFLYSKDFSYVPPVDPIYHLQTIDIIANSNGIPLGEGKGFAYAYSYFPGTHILLAAITMITGVDSITILKISTLLYLIIPFIFYSFVRAVFRSERIAQLASVIFIFVPMQFPQPHYKFLGMVFLLLYLCSLFSLQERGERKYLFLVLTTLTALSVSHPLTLYVMLGMVAFSSISSYLPQSLTRIKFSWFSNRLTLITLAIGSLWPLYVAYVLSFKHVNWIAQWATMIFEQEQPLVPYIPSTYTVFEQIFVPASFSSVLVLGFLGFLLYIRGKNYNARFTVMTIYFFTSFILLYINRHQSIWISFRAFLWLFLTAAPLAAYFIVCFERCRRLSKHTINKAHFLFFFVLLSFVLSAVDAFPRNFYDFNYQCERDTVMDMRGFGERLFNSVKWYGRFGGEVRYAIGDRSVKDLVGHFSSLDDTILIDYDVYLRPKEHIQLLSVRRIKFVFTHDVMALLYPRTTWEFFEYANVVKVDVSNLTYLRTSDPLLNRAYDNGLAQVLQVN